MVTSLPQDHLRAVPESESAAAMVDDNQPRASTDLAQGTAALYVDTDNQSAQLAQPLLKALADDLNVPVAEITVAGNNVGKRLDQWRNQLADSDPELRVHVLDVPAHKEAADIALILDLGANLGRHIDEGHLVIVMSRDELLIGAAEQVRTRGARVLLAYGDSATPSSENSALTTLLLPTVPKPRQVTTPVDVSLAGTLPQTAPTVDTNSVASVVAGIHQMCLEQPGGGYQPTDVGQALVKLGFVDASARRAFLQSVPNLVSRGKAGDKRLLF
jgi:hypothetical protein